jgi:hypothetical protein
MFAALAVLLTFQTLDVQRKEDVALPVSVNVDQVIMDGTGLLEELGGQLHPLAAHYLQSYRRLKTRLRMTSKEGARATESRSSKADMSIIKYIAKE